jgi:hypothetical protein
MVSTATAVAQINSDIVVENIKTENEFINNLEEKLGKNALWNLGDIIVLILRLIFRSIFVAPAAAFGAFVSSRVLGGYSFIQALIYAIRIYIINIFVILWINI